MKTINHSTSLRINGESFDSAQDAEPVEARSRTIKFYTLGCKVNQYDTQSIRARFMRAGFEELDNGCPSRFCLINTCTVTAVADAKSRELIRRIKRENPDAKIIVTGCLAQKDAPSLSGVPDVDFIISKSFFPDGIGVFKGNTRAFLKIQDGCNNFCSFCKVPYVRGRSRSRTLSEVTLEAERLVKTGVKEIVLCGICLGSYGKDGLQEANLVEVIESLENIGGLLRIRLSSIEPMDVNAALIRKLRSSKKLCRHLHIPLQSGDDSILKMMNRNYDSATYLRLINEIKGLIEGIAITTDVLVGFPCESEENFQNTVNLIREINPLRTHIFCYSRREPTAAAKKFKSNIAPQTVKRRAAYLKGVANDCSLVYRKRFLGKEPFVLIENRSKEEPYFWQGHTDNYIKVLIKSRADLKNRLIKALLVECASGVMIGKLKSKAKIS
ncbi:MAG: MiaB/RimO family radical SAM methylthiotransferase [Candidatus Omnitrophota bacterium]|nr:MiaB/RimO family radical SAM methylthiotransferase [Candidatus Omnitrophota bacterium]